MSDLRTPSYIDFLLYGSLQNSDSDDIDYCPSQDSQSDSDYCLSQDSQSERTCTYLKIISQLLYRWVIVMDNLNMK